MSTRSWLLSLALAPAVALGCGSAAPHVSPGPAPPAPSPLGAAATDIPALGARFFGDGMTSQLETDDERRVTRVRILKTRANLFVPAGTSFSEHAQKWMLTYGDAFGWGHLGAAESEGELAGFPANGPRVLLSFPAAEGCPGLVTSVDYGKGSVVTFYMATLVCPSAPGAAARIASLRIAEPPPIHEAIASGPTAAAASSAAPHPGDPVADWLRRHGWEPTGVGRPNAGLLTISLGKKVVAPAEARRAFAVRFAREVASASGFPLLDLVEATDFNARAPGAVPRLRRVELHMSAPPVDGACIDPQVDIELAEPPDAATDASYWPSQIGILCEREPQGGPKAPATTARALPRAASRAVPFLAMCRGYNFNGGARTWGWVLDKKGDIYAFKGGRFEPPKTVRQLTVLLRHEKRYAGTLLPDDVDRLAELTAKVEREALNRKEVHAPDRGGGGCELFKGGGSPEELGRIELGSSSATGEAGRSGAASAEAQKIIDRAGALDARGN